MGFLFFSITAAIASAPVLSPSQSVPELDTPDATVDFVSHEETQKPTVAQPTKKQPQRSFEPFTGKITGSRVRVRLQPSLDGLILKELAQGELVIVTGEIDDFYAVKPDPKCKGYIYRAYVLDNVVEANNVNLRIEPDTHAPILTQLGQGDSVKGSISKENNKWLEIELPETVRFYISKDYLANVGDVSLYKRTQTRRQQLSTRLDMIDSNIQAELKKPFAEIQLVSFVNDLKAITSQNQDLPEVTDRAQSLIRNIQEQYLQLSLGKPLDAAKGVAIQTAAAEPQTQVSALDTASSQEASTDVRRFSSFALEQQENKLVEQAINSGKAETKDTFYAEELKNSQEISGQLVPYDRPVKNRPGDFMLVDAKTKVPMAYLYSNRLDLNQFAGQPVHLVVAPRPNHHFALPAYFVLEIKHI